MDFGQALEAMRVGKRVARSGWNGKGMFLFRVGDWNFSERAFDEVSAHLPSLPFIAMKTADEKVVPWLASQTDMLAEDWAEV